LDELAVVKREVTSAISTPHGLSVAISFWYHRGRFLLRTSGKIR
jgi:hypothetical protein